MAADCAVVFSGDLCGCVCPNDAINVSDKLRYDADARAGTARCAPTRAQCVADCIAMTASCQAGRCVAVPTP
ncbi:MAG: hypothetical protein INH41_05315 [Myxococcaceae bacterium]|nr:hypothetical protein [Myxococcaceae bacterium]MCA3011804.1 hypothetical protein [Myxococcaceae bacterium]